jgi:hypothetical protein
MRPAHLIARLPVLALVSAMCIVSPAFAQDSDIIFAAGTGAQTTGMLTEVSASNLDAALENTASSDFDAPLAQRSARRAEAEMIAIADTLANRDTQDGVAHMAEAVGETMLKLPVGKFIAAIENARAGTVRKRYRQNDTLADVAGRDAKALPEMLGKQSRVAMKMVSGFSKAFASMIPEFAKLSRELETTMSDIKAKRR